jgi:hypothetical protein
MGLPTGKQRNGGKFDEIMVKNKFAEAPSIAPRRLYPKTCG